MPRFIITTSTNTDRHRNVMELMDQHDTIPIMATDWRLYEYAGLTAFKAKHHSLVMAYRQIAQMVMVCDINYYIVMEDDLHIIDPVELEEAIDNLPDDPWDVCYLTRTTHNNLSGKTEPYNGYFARIISDWWETPITAWSREFAIRFDEFITEKLKADIWCGHIDHILLQLNQGRHFGAMYKSAVGSSSEPKEKFHVKSSITE